jgi:alcohol dehydrogenase
MAHILEVFYGANGQAHYDQMVRIAEVGLPLVVEYLPRLREDPADVEAREALGLATDLGGYAIMLGGTNGAHLTSFSLVDILSHGRACALMQPYYTVFFSPVIEAQLRLLGGVLKEGGYLEGDLSNHSGRELGVAVAEGMFAFARAIGFPTTLGEVDGFGPQHIERALTAAKNPQLKMKLENMPVPLTAETVDEFMGPVLQAAESGDLGLVRTL